MPKTTAKTPVKKEYKKISVKDRLNDLDAKLAKSLIDAIKGGNYPAWLKGICSHRPVNAATKKFYRGSNIATLYAHEYYAQQGTGVYLTYVQAQKIGGLKLKKGSTAAYVFKFGIYVKGDPKNNTPAKQIKGGMLDLFDNSPEDETNITHFWRFAPVFDLGDFVNIDPKIDKKGDLLFAFRRFKPKNPEELPLWLPRIMKSLEKENGTKIIHTPICETGAFSPKQNIIKMPLETQFDKESRYISTLLHEMAHATAAKVVKRDNKIRSWGDQLYAAEELIAELSAAMVLNRAGLTMTLDNSTAYLAFWGKHCKNDPSCVRHAIKTASKIADLFCQWGGIADPVFDDYTNEEEGDIAFAY